MAQGWNASIPRLQDGYDNEELSNENRIPELRLFLRLQPPRCYVVGRLFCLDYVGHPLHSNMALMISIECHFGETILPLSDMGSELVRGECIFSATAGNSPGKQGDGNENLKSFPAASALRSQEHARSH